MKKKLISTLLIILAATLSAMGSETVEVTADAQIVNGDVASAKIEAEARAKWSAIERTSKVKVSVDTIVHNDELLDESVKSAVSSTVSGFSIIDEGTDRGVYWLKAKVTVDPDEAVTVLTKNMTILVYLPLIRQNGTVEEMHPFSDAVIQELIAKGFTVVDLTSFGDKNISKQLYDATQNNNMAAVQNILSNYIAGSALIGKINVVDKGKDVGYTNISFSIVDGELSYRVIGNDKGKKTILKAGTMQGRGQAANAETAAIALSKSLAKRNSAILASEVATKIAGSNKKSVMVTLVGNTDLHAFEEFRHVIQNISWVTDIKEAGSNSLVVDYPEKTLYLATIISKNGGYKIRKFSENEILVLPK